MSPYDLIDMTWPAASMRDVGGWTIREGKGGGSRVSAATWDGNGAPDIATAEAAMVELGQHPLFMLREGDQTIDEILAARGYQVKDPVVLYAIDPAELAQEPPPVSSFATWPPLAIQAEIWAAGGIGPARLAIMDRVAGPKTTLFGRVSDKPAGTAFVGSHGNWAMLHALEVAEPLRRQGLAQIMMRHAGLWAQNIGANRLFLLVTRENVGANALYTSLKFKPVGHYHYRIKNTEAAT